MTDVDDEWDESGFDDLVGDRFTADVSTVDAQDTLDVSAQFFRVCARVYMDNPLHNPVYEWLSRLPRTGNGNIKAISDHLVLALRLYVDTLNSGSVLRLGTADSERQPLSPGTDSREEERYSAASSPSRRYRQSSRFREALAGEGAVLNSRSASTSSSPEEVASPLLRTPVSSGQDARLSSSASTSPGSPFVSAVSAPSSSPSESPILQDSQASAKGVNPEDGLSYVARLARERDGW